MSRSTGWAEITENYRIITAINHLNLYLQTSSYSYSSTFPSIKLVLIQNDHIWLMQPTEWWNDLVTGFDYMKQAKGEDKIWILRSQIETYRSTLMIRDLQLPQELVISLHVPTLCKFKVFSKFIKLFPTKIRLHASQTSNRKTKGNNTQNKILKIPAAL